MENRITLKAKDLYSLAFKKTKEHFFKFLAVGFCFFLLGLIDPSGEKGANMVFIRTLISFFGSIYLSISLFSALLDIANNKTVTLANFFTWPKNGFKMFFTDLVAKLAVAPFIVGIIVLSVSLGVGVNAVVGLIFAIIGLIVAIPVSIFLSVRLSLAKYLALENGSGIVESIKKSYNLTNGYFWILLVLNLYGGLVILLGLVALIVGLLWAIPTVIIAQVLIYKAFSDKMKSHLVPEVENLELPANPSVSDAVN